MARIYSTIAKFRRVEAAIRQSAAAQLRAVREIDRALGAERTARETDILSRLRQRCAAMRQDCIDAVIWLNDKLDAKKGRLRE